MRLTTIDNLTYSLIISPLYKLWLLVYNLWFFNSGGMKVNTDYFSYRFLRWWGNMKWNGKTFFDMDNE